MASFGDILSSLALAASQAVRRNAANDGFEAFDTSTVIDHDHSGDAGDGGQLEGNAAILSTGMPAGSLLRADGDNGAGWSTDLPAHEHTGTGNDGDQLEADEALLATDITDGYVLTADGAGAVAWEAVPSGGSGYCITFGQYSSTSWDGDSKSSAGTIDLSAVFGLPAGIKGIAARLAVKDSNANAYGYIAKDSGGAAYGLFARVANSIFIGEDSGVVQCDANGDVYFGLSESLDEVYLYIDAYFS